MLIAAEIDADGMPVKIATSTQGASLDVIGTGSSHTWLIVGLAIGAVIVIGAVGGGLVLVRRRS